MTPAVRALLEIVEEAEASYVGQEIENVIEDARERGIDTGSGTPTVKVFRALAARGVLVPERVRIYGIALDALRAEEEAARVRVADRLYETDEPGVGNPFNGRSILRDNGDGFTFEDVFALDALEVGEAHTYGGGAVAQTTIRRIK